MMNKEDGDKGPKSDNETATIGWMDLADNDIEIIYFKGKLYRCPMCEHAFRSRNSTKDHFNKEHRGFRFQCPCGKEYKVKSSLTKHQEKCKQAA
ncbi:zinc finger C2H2 protein ECU03_0790-like [Haliotis rufescens]|uniref:zinc finger C2H2 protein ECU03_0790-like n=1 Tax=Haliotis rufescens TaxID=6454 RepID=UPI001EB0AE30|nr:zinc finger C2H2 protein ECU03_0790-like [Haliotis rufescens]